MNGGNMQLREFQTGMKPWHVQPTAKNVEHVDPCFMVKHALFHTMKATGKIADMADEHDHDGATASPIVSFDKSAKYLADLVVCAMKMATEAGIDLQEALHARMKDKGLI